MDDDALREAAEAVVREYDKTHLTHDVAYEDVAAAIDQLDAALRARTEAPPAPTAVALADAMHHAGICAGWQPDDPADHDRDHLADAEATSSSPSSSSSWPCSRSACGSGGRPSTGATATTSRCP